MTGLPSTIKQIPGATIAAAPQLRDLKAEAVAFVPTIIKRRKAAPIIGAGTLSVINAAPTQTSEEGEGKIERVSLLSALKSDGVVGETVVKRTKGKEDYERFLNDMGDLL